MSTDSEHNADTVRTLLQDLREQEWLQDWRPDLCERIDAVLLAPQPKSFRGMGHRRENQDRCEDCGLTGQAFEASKQKGWAIACPVPHNNGCIHPRRGGIVDGSEYCIDCGKHLDYPKSKEGSTK